MSAAGTITTSWGSVLTWTLVEDRQDHLLVRVDDERGEFLTYSLARRDGTALCRCEHRDRLGATHCHDARRALAKVRAEFALALTSTLPAPEGARALKCDRCHAWWPARLGGACGRCGDAGTVAPLQVRVTKGTQYVLASTGLGAELVVEDLTAAGFAVETYQHGAGTALVKLTRGVLPGVKAALRAKGWEVTS